MKRHLSLVRWESARAPLALAEVAARSGVHPEFVRSLFRLAIIDPISTRPLRFEPSVVSRVRRVYRLRRSFGTSLDALGLVLDLLERIDDLEHRLARYEPRR